MFHIKVLSRSHGLIFDIDGTLIASLSYFWVEATSTSGTIEILL
jgi:hypothetical protein